MKNQLMHDRPRKRLGEVCIFQNGYAFKSSEYVKEGFFVMRIKNVQNGYISLADPQYIDVKREEEFGKFILNEGDILMSLTGNIGRVGVIKKDHLPALLNQRVARIKPIKGDILDAEYLFHFFNSNTFEDIVMGLGSGAAQQNISLSAIENLEIPLPPLATQKAIVAKLDETFAQIDEAIVTTQANIERTNELTKSVLDKVFEEGEWERVKLKKVTNVITKGSSPRWQGFEYQENGILFITSENVGRYKLILDKKKFLSEKFNDIQGRSILKKDDILMNIVGASIGRTAIFDLDCIANINQAVCIIRLNQQLINKRFALYFFNSNGCLNYMDNEKVENARANLSMSNIGNFDIPLPSLSKQAEIVTYLDQVFSQSSLLKSQYEAKLVELKELKASVLQGAFEGKVI